MKCFLLLSVAISLSAAQPLDSEQLLIRTKSGLVRGTKAGNVRMFRSIPYATPPLGDLRWAPPEAVSPWSDTVNATVDPPGCPQLCTLPPHGCPATISEDCLFLNIFAPLQSSSSVAVLVFIHGGNFKQGFSGGLLYDGTNFVDYTATILVAINYRLGALGQLWSAEAGMSGNYGFLDQKVAMQWIWDNIGFFGGDRSRITLFGQSAGAISAALHMAQRSESDSKLFRSAILESEPLGIPLRDTSTWGLLPRYFLNALDCTEEHSADLWRCLRSRSVAEILSAQKQCEESIAIELPDHFMDLFLPWTPTMGTDLFPSHPIRAFQRGLLREMPFVIGTVRDEGRSFIYEGYPDAVNKKKAREIMALLIGPENALKVWEHYPMPGRSTTDYRDYLALIATDGLFKCPTRNATASSSSSSAEAVYLYHFDHASSFNERAWNLNYSSCWGPAICHGEELTYVFRPDLSAINASYTESETELAFAVQAYWTQFAATGSPGDGGAVDPNETASWIPFAVDTESSLRFQVDSVAMENEVDLKHSHCAFWDSLDYGWIR